MLLKTHLGVNESNLSNAGLQKIINTLLPVGGFVILSSTFLHRVWISCSHVVLWTFKIKFHEINWNKQCVKSQNWRYKRNLLERICVLVDVYPVYVVAITY